MNNSELPGGGQLSRKERERQRYRKEILEAASELFALHGYEKTSMQQIADNAELSVGKLYSHFGGKEEIYREVIAFHAKEIGEKCELACTPGMAPLDQIRARISAAIEHCSSNANFLRLFDSGWQKELNDLERQAKEEQSNIIVDLFRQAAERGEIHKEDPRLLAVVVGGALHGIFDFARESNFDSLEMIPGLIDRLILKPLETGRRASREMEAS